MKHWLGWAVLAALLGSCTGGTPQPNPNPNPTPTTYPLPPQYAVLGRPVTVPLPWSPQQPQIKVGGILTAGKVSGQAVVFTLPAPKVNPDGTLSGGSAGGPKSLQIVDGANTGKGTLNVLGNAYLKSDEPNKFMLLSTSKASQAQLLQLIKDLKLPINVQVIPLGGPGSCGGSLLIGTYTGTDLEKTLAELDARAKANPELILGVNPVSIWTTGATYTPINGADAVSTPLARSRGWNGKGAVIAVLDTGVGLQSTREWGSRLLPGHQFTAAGESAVTADDFTGPVTDEDGMSAATVAMQGHGSQVASLAAGTTFGVAPAAEVLPVKVCDSKGKCRTSDVLRGVCWALAYGQARFPGDMKRLILNLSIGGDTGGFEQDVMRVVLKEATDLGVTVVASAGNQWADYVRGGGDLPVSYPAALDLPGLIAVGALRQPLGSRTYELSGFSNRGAWVDLLAPGSLVKAVDAYGQTRDFNRGTSFAAPLVAGAAALWRQKLPAASPTELQKLLQDNADTTSVTLSAEDAARVTRRMLSLKALP